MDREILFRGKRIKTGEWGYGDLIHAISKTFVGEEEEDIFWMEAEVDPATVGQFTGLTDKNGFTKIFEGDIVRWDDKSKGKYWRVCKLIWNVSHFELHGVTFDTITPNDKEPVDFKFGSFIYEYNGILEIIGNIYQSDSALYTVA